MRDLVSVALSAACHTVVQDNVLINNASDLNDQVKKGVWAMTDEERLAFRKAYKDMEKFVKTKYVYRPPPLAMVGVSDMASRTVATVSVQAEELEAPHVTETDGSGIIAPRLARVAVATAATPGTGVASEETLSVSAPPSVVGVILTPPATEVVAESVPATPLPPWTIAVAVGHSR